ncbi:MAG: hypothetical protein QOF02_389 [Blastocatellia bacterium]|jgi:hypothetical protein|nr:hypothetical protein [Blastocatellia bacterium]
MNGLRVYINAESADAHGSRQLVFYSRRAAGPYYCWRYEEQAGQWLCSRLHPPDWTPKTLCVASWKAVPVALQARLGEHYLD